MSSQWKILFYIFKCKTTEFKCQLTRKKWWWNYKISWNFLFYFHFYSWGVLFARLGWANTIHHSQYESLNFALLTNNICPCVCLSKQRNIFICQVAFCPCFPYWPISKALHLSPLSSSLCGRFFGKLSFTIQKLYLNYGRHLQILSLYIFS